MFDSATIASLIAASVALLLGPSSMLVLSRSISHGRATALATCLGNFAGLLVGLGLGRAMLGRE